MRWSYPPYPFRPRSRTLAADDGTRIITENGEELPSGSYEEWVQSATGSCLDVRVDRCPHFRYLDDAIRDPHARVSGVCNGSDSSPRIVRIDWRVGNKRATLFGADAWQDGVDDEALRTHRQAIDLLQCGTFPTPGSLGDATIRKALDGPPSAVAKLRALPIACRGDVKKTLVGLRTETPAEPGTYLPEATEIDRSACYVTECLAPIPCGRVRPLTDEAYVGENEWYVARCVVTITRTIPLGPFPIRASDGTLEWPVRPGIYQDVWLTRGEVSDTRLTGCLVQVVGGWVWSEMRPFLREWAETMLKAREEAPTKEVKAYVKRTGNAAIGRHAMTGIPLKVTTGDKAAPPLAIDGQISCYMAIPDHSRQTTNLPHVALFIWSEARRHLYARQLAEMASGNTVLLTNTDGMILEKPSILPSNGWRERTLTNLIIVADRSYWCDQKIVLPGQTGATRESAIEWAERFVFEREELRRNDPMEYWRRYIKPKEMRKRSIPRPSWMRSSDEPSPNPPPTDGNGPDTVASYFRRRQKEKVSS